MSLRRFAIPLWLTAIVVVAAGLFTLSIDAPLGYHFDEPKKVAFVQNNTQDFLHPILMLELTRWVVALFGVSQNDQDIVQAGRSVSAAAGVICILLMFALSRREVGTKWALVIAAMAATCPAIVVHAHYMKEDMVLLASLLATLLALVRLQEYPSDFRAIVLGCCAGLAFSSHYKSILLLPIGMLYLFANRPRVELSTTSTRSNSDLQIESPDSKPDRKLSIYHLLFAGLAASLVFAFINEPAFYQWRVLQRGVAYEFNHALAGHRGVRLTPSDEWFSYHLRFSIPSGLTLGVAMLGLAGIAVSLFNLKRTAPVTRLLLLFAGIYYLVAELSPTKPPPDEMRYVLPCMIGLLYFAGLTLRCISGIRYLALRCVLLTISLIAGPLAAATDAGLVAWHMKHDSRTLLLNWLKAEEIDRGCVYFSVFTAAATSDRNLSINLNQVLRSDSDYWVLSSFTYSPLLYASRFPRQDSRVIAEAMLMRRILDIPNRRIDPAYRSIGFSDPTLHVFDLQKHRVHLTALASDLSEFDRETQ